MIVLAHVLQPWVTLRGKTSSTVIRQSETDWLTLDGFRDLTAWIHVTQAPEMATNTFALETSPSYDDALFQTLVSQSVATGGLYVAISRGKLATVPLERIVRWSFTSTASNWVLTFRIIVCANATEPAFRLTRGDEVFTNPALGGAA